MTIRFATVNDLSIINSLFYELDSLSIEQQPQHFQRGERSIEYLTEIINNDNSVFLVCELDNEVIGFSLIYLKEVKGLNLLVPCTYAYIQDFVISKLYRNNGYGQKLMDESKKWAALQGAEYLRLSVIPKNTDGIRFYKKNGLMEQMITMECKI